MYVKKITIAIHIFFYLITSYARAQNTLVIPEGTTPVMDGIVNSAEWADADSAVINISTGISCKVLYKHDCNHLHLAYLDNLESMNMLFPEVLFDLNNSKTASWEADDWWFHVSATDCFYQGAYAVYSNCLAVQPNWTGIPNFSSGPPNTDTVEIQIPLATINMSLPDTIGICFLVTNTFNNWKYWPSTSTTSSPATWGTAILSCANIGINENEISDPFSMYLSPSGNEIIIDGKSEGNIYAVDIIDSTGRKIKSFSGGKGQKLTVNISDLQSGVVLVKLITSDKKEFVKKVQVIH